MLLSPDLVRLRLTLQRTEGAFERVVATMYRRRILFESMQVASDSRHWYIEVEALLSQDRADSAVGALRREPRVVSADVAPALLSGRR